MHKARSPLIDASRDAGRYELKQEIARGGMGAVYLAYDRLAGREVAYKRLLLPEGPDRARFSALFQREFDTLTRLAHPAIVTVYEYGFDRQGPFYTMEFLEGRGLAEQEALAHAEACRVIRDVASALALLHARKLVHRDLSPANVRVDRRGRTKLIDFGALHPFGPAPEVVGTPAFMAPEVLEGRALDQRADLYALGALAYWALTRRTAVRARSIAELPAAWLDPVLPPSTLAPGIPAALDELVLSLLARDPLARPSSAAEVIERLTSIADLKPEGDEAKVAASYMAHPPLVGREGVLALFDAALHGLLRSKGGCLLVQAEPGRGRSALLDQAVVRAQLSGATVLRADGGKDNAPFGLARNLVRSAQALYPEAIDPLVADHLELQRALRGELTLEGTWSPVQASERQARTLEAMRRVVLEVATRNPTIIVVDDLERADAESQALLAMLSEDTAEQGLFLIASAQRGAGGSDALAKVENSSRRISLEPLTLAQTTELIDGMFGAIANSQRLAAWLYERGAGNPARCMDLLHLLLQRGVVRYTAGTFALPHDVDEDVAWSDAAAALLARLSDLSVQARRAASALSLQDMPMKIHTLAQTLSSQPSELVRALEELCARGAVSLSEERAVLTSSALRHALVQAMGAPEKRELQVRSARALLAQPALDSAARLQAGMHLLQAGEEAEAIALLTARGDNDFLRGSTPFPLLEAVLEALRRHGRSDEQCLSVLVPLVRGGFFGDLQSQQRHLDRTLHTLAKVCGVEAMARIAPRLGAKPALIGGIAAGLYHHARTPSAMRYGKYPETVAALLSILSASVAACVSAFETKQALDIGAMFEPLRAFGPDSAPFWSIEFCLATAELGVNRYASARRRYQRLLERFERPVKGMSDDIHMQFKQGILHGLAQSLVADTDPRALELADALEQAHVFFAPHAQTVRMGYYGYRGQMEECEQYRRRGEMLALRGGISWSAVTIMTVRSAYMAVHTSDVVALLRVPAELERLSAIAPKLELYRAAVLAALELMRGRAQRAVAAYEELFANPDAAYMMVHWADQAMYARALAACGRHEHARQVCEAQLARVGPDEVLYVRKGAIQQRALALAASGDLGGAIGELDTLIGQLEPYKNPLWSGTAHRDRAKVALFAQDQAGFERHAQAMTALYHSTKNPALIQQCELLQAAAQTLGRGARKAQALDETALAFETHQSRLVTSDMESFTTEMLPESAPVNDQGERPPHVQSK